MPTGDRNDPYAAFNLTIEVDRVTEAGFNESSGLGTDSPTAGTATATARNVLTKRPGLTKFPNILLKRGFTTNDSLWNWPPTSD